MCLCCKFGVSSLNGTTVMYCLTQMYMYCTLSVDVTKRYVLALNEESLLDSKWEAQNVSQHHFRCQECVPQCCKAPEKRATRCLQRAQENLQCINFVNFSKLSTLRTLLCQKSTLLRDHASQGCALTRQHAHPCLPFLNRPQVLGILQIGTSNRIIWPFGWAPP